MVIKFMKKKEKSFILIVVIFILVLQLINLSTTRQKSIADENTKLIKSDINSINTLSITYRVNKSNLLNDDFSKYNPEYNSYYWEVSSKI